MAAKLVIFSSPSGAGKTTIVKHLLSCDLDLSFSVSATSRGRREGEVDGQDYFFLDPAAFDEKIAAGAFLEWEEVYEGIRYGTLKSEVDRILSDGKNVIFDVDVKGGLNIKKEYGEEALAVFVNPPSLEALEKRLRKRATEDEASLSKRLKRAEMEITFADKFDKVIVNDDLTRVLPEAEDMVASFLQSNKTHS